MTTGEAIIALLSGIALVLAILLAFCFIIILLGKLFDMIGARLAATPANAPAPAEEQAAAPAVEEKTTAEGVKLINVADETAAMIMAIVADTTGISPERLHFDYIKLLED